MSLMSDVTHQVKHPPTCTIHSLFTGGLKSVFFFVGGQGGGMSSSLVGSSSSGSGGVERGKGYEQTVVLVVSSMTC